MSADWLDWLFWVGGWSLAAGGGVLLVWALAGERSRGRRRCRRCWYDMGATKAVEGASTCPECGKRAGRELDMLRTRRRWRWAALSCGVWVMSYFVWTTPRIRDEGWTGAVPTTAAIVGMEFLVPSAAEDEVFARPTEVLKADDPRAALYRNILRKRIGADNPQWLIDLCLWQARRAARSPDHVRWALASCTVQAFGWQRNATQRQLAALESLVHVRVLTRPSWCVGDEIFARVSLERPSLHLDRSYLVELIPLSEGLRSVSGRHDALDLEIERRLAPGSAPVTSGASPISLGRCSESDGARYEIVIYRLANSSLTNVTRDSLVHHGTKTLATSGTRRQVLIPRSAEIHIGSPRFLPGFVERGLLLVLPLDDPITFDTGSTAIAGLGSIEANDQRCHEFRFWMGTSGYATESRLMLETDLEAARLDCHESHTMHLRGDHNSALRDIGTTQFWDGEIVVSIQ